MSFKTIKTGFIIAALASLLAACSSTSTEDTAGTGVGMGTDSGSSVSTGTSQGSAVYADDPTMGGTLDTVFYFDFDSSVLRQDARAALNVHAEKLRNSPMYVRLEGHADERGTREYNMALGERRANAVKEFLVLQGVNGAYLEVISYGEERPAALGSDDSSWSLNRRVELTKR
jgi:peptidoglycan-associated lipoprotein